MALLLGPMLVRRIYELSDDKKMTAGTNRRHFNTIKGVYSLTVG